MNKKTGLEKMLRKAENVQNTDELNDLMQELGLKASFRMSKQTLIHFLKESIAEED